VVPTQRKAASFFRIALVLLNHIHASKRISSCGTPIFISRLAAGDKLAKRIYMRRRAAMKEVEYEFIPVGPMPGEREEIGSMDAVSLLKADHRKVKEMLKTAMKSQSSSEKKKLVQQICLELTVHAKIEEELVYPLLRQEDEKEAEEAELEHSLVKFMIRDLEKGSLKGVELDARIKVLNELVTHHVKEEETSALPELEKAGDIDMQDLGMRLAERKEMIMKREQRSAKRSSSRSRSKAARTSSSKRKTR
jgi:hypothetical protein